MRYRIICPVCDEQYWVDVPFEPQMCFKCGHKDVFVSNHRTHSKVDAQLVMAELDEMAPRIDAAYEEYTNLMQNWQDCCHKLRSYKERGVIPIETYEKYRSRYSKKRSSKNG